MSIMPTALLMPDVAEVRRGYDELHSGFAALRVKRKGVNETFYAIWYARCDEWGIDPESDTGEQVLEALRSAVNFDGSSDPEGE